MTILKLPVPGGGLATDKSIATFRCQITAKTSEV